MPLFLCWFLAVSFNVSAVVDANSPSNTNAPPDGSPWENVGQIGEASGTYIGGGWVLTASHVGSGSIILTGTTFSPDGTSIRLTNSDGTSTDLLLFHLATIPLLPSLALAPATPGAFSQIDMIGVGRIAGSAQTNFGPYTGFEWSVNGAKSWGNNKVNLGGTTTIDLGYGKLTTFVTDFTSPGTIGPGSQTSDEAQAATGDSGGGVFRPNGSNWELAGVVDAVQAQLNQPASTAAYGDKTYIADMATYRSEIIAVLTASPVPNLSISLSGGNAQVCWPDMGVNYNLEATATLTNPSWTPIGQNQFLTNGQVCAPVPLTSGLRYFRLQKP